MSGRGWLPYAAGIGAVAAMVFTLGRGPSLAEAVPTAGAGRPGESSRAARQQVAAAAFLQMVPVLKHPRCANCHSPMNFYPGDKIKDIGAVSIAGQQYYPEATHPGGEIRLPTYEETFGGNAICTECHTKAPPAWQTGPEWPLASVFRLCLQMKRARTDGQDLLDHLATDTLIKLAFDGTRAQDLPPEPPPMSHSQFLVVAKAWITAMNAMAKYPNDPQGCPHAVLWTGSVDYTYSEVVGKTTVSARGSVEFSEKGGTWAGESTRTEDHSAKGCPSVLTGVAVGGASDLSLAVVDFTGADPLTGLGGPGNTSAFASLTVTPGGHKLTVTLPLEGKKAYAGGGPACPGYLPRRSDYNFVINGEGDGKIDPRNPDEFAGTSTVRPSPGITLTTTWKLTRTRE
jgi:hypothetical protein